MGASEILGWVDRRGPDSVLGGLGRRNSDRGLVGQTMTREQSDWLYRYRWWPWVLVAIVLPLKLWPAGWWLDVDVVQVQSARVGDPIPMLVEREIRRPFHGEWNITVRQWDGSGWLTYCNARGMSNYQPGARFPKALTLQWWTDGQCHPLPVGRYKITTHWTINAITMFDDPEVVIDSNIFEVRP